jgi:hypothetical protein
VLFFLLYIGATLLLNIAWRTGWATAWRRPSSTTKKQG